MVRIREVEAMEGFRLRLALTDGRTIERDVGDALVGPIFVPVRSDPSVFRSVRVEGGGLVWPNGADLCPDLVIWGGLPPAEATSEPRSDGQRAAP